MNMNNREDSFLLSEEKQSAPPVQRILNDVIPSLIASSEEDEDVQSPYGSIRIRSEQQITAFVDSRIGGRKENQDSAGFQDTALGAVIVVCDGMGGMNGGRMASSLAVTTILKTIAAAPRGTDRKGILLKAIRKANEAILAYGAENPSYAGMGTTVTVIIVSDYSVVGAYVGDSRIYQLRGKSKVFRTFDHSMVFEMVKRKALTEEQARLSAQSNVILKALGVSETVEPDVFEQPYLKGDRFILCSDGFWGAMPEEEFLAGVSGKDDTDKVLADMMRKVDEIGQNSGGKHDNLTAAFVDMEQDSKLKEKMNKTAKTIIAALAVCLLVSLVFNFIPSSPEQNDVPEDVAESQESVVQEEKEEVSYAISLYSEFEFAYDNSKYARIYFTEFSPEAATLEYSKDRDVWITVDMAKADLEEYAEGFMTVGNPEIIYYGEKSNGNAGKNTYALAIMEDDRVFLLVNSDSMIEMKRLNK